MKFNIILISILLALSSCGYSMRGSVNVPSSVKSVSVMSNYYSELVSVINSSLASSNIGVSRSEDANLHGIHVLSEEFDRRQLSINASGRVNEYELIYTVKFQLKAPGKSDVEDKIILYRDYSFDENNIMGNSDREDYIKKGMISTASTLIFNKLISSINNQ